MYSPWLLLIIAVVALLTIIAVRHAVMMHKGWHYCPSQLCGRLHPPATVERKEVRR